MEEVAGFETANLLKEMGYDLPTLNFYTTGKKPYLTEAEDYMSERLVITNWNNGMGSFPTRASDVSCSAPKIYEVIMWLYNNHKIWITVDMTGSEKFCARGRMINDKGELVGDFKIEGRRLIKKTPSKAYEAAINHVLNNIIKERLNS